MNLRLIYLVPLFLITCSGIIIPQSVSDTLRGIILDISDDTPIAGAVIKFKNTENYTTSNLKGLFTLVKKDSAEQELEISHIAYKPSAIRLRSNLNSYNLIVHLTSSYFKTETVIVSGRHSNTSHTDEDTYIEVLRGKDLERSLGSTLASTLKNEAGIAIRSMGPAPSRPVIRGMGGDRVLLLEDGFRTVDLSATSPDHAVSLDPFSIERIEVIRGPAVLIYSPVTIGGVVNSIRREINGDFSQSVEGNIGLYGESSNRGLLGSGLLKIPLGDFLGRFEFSRRSTDDLQSPTGTLKNSASGLTNGAFSLSHKFSSGYTGIAARDFSLDYGIPGGFVGAHPDGVHIKMFRRVYSGLYSISPQSKYINNVTIRLTRNFFSQTEYESSGLIGAEFGMTDYALHAEAETKSMWLFSHGSVGIESEYRDFQVGGFVFTSPAINRQVAGYIYQNIPFTNSNLELGLRITHGSFSPSLSGKIINGKVIAPVSFTIPSFSLSYQYNVSENIAAGAAFHKTSRLPSIEELYSAGPHLAAYSYETGNPDLKPENGYGFEIFSGYTTESLSLRGNVYFNILENFLLPRNNGKINFATLLPVYETTGEKVRLFGGEFQAEAEFPLGIKISNVSSLTYGEFSGGSPMPSIPPFKNITTISAAFSGVSLGIRTTLAMAQNKTDIYEFPTPGYGAHDFFVQYSYIQSHLIHNFSLNVDNIFNKEFRNHLSRVKSILPEPGRSFRVVYRMFF